MSGLADRRRNLGPIDFQRIDTPSLDSDELTNNQGNATQPRPVFVRQGVAAQNSGSCYLEVGDIKIMATVNGPLQLRGEFQSQAEIEVSVNIQEFSGVEHKEETSKSIAEFVKSCITPAIILEEIPKSLIQVSIRILSGTVGSAQKCASVNASIMALINAGIVLHDMVTAVSVVQKDEQFFVDVDVNENSENVNQLLVAYKPATKKIVSFQIMSAQAVSKESIEALLSHAEPACLHLRNAFASYLLEDYVKESSKSE